jgi:hypothetical protein
LKGDRDGNLCRQENQKQDEEKLPPPFERGQFPFVAHFPPFGEMYLVLA